MNKVKKSDPDGILLAGLTEQNGGQLIKDKVAVFGPNDGSVALMAPDGFAQQSTIDEAGPASAGMIATVPGRAPRAAVGFRQAVREATGIKDRRAAGGDLRPYAGQAASPCSMRSSRPETGPGLPGGALWHQKVTDGITGDFTITDTGIRTSARSRSTRPAGEFEPVEVIEPRRT